MNPLDHLLWASPSLDDGIAALERLTGVAAARGGTHPGFGTRNALASLSDGYYLEIISPDEEQETAGTLGETIADLKEPRLLRFAVSTTDIAGVADRLARDGLTSQHVKMSRTRPDGVRLDWQVLHPEGHDFGFHMPFFIQWDTPHHPSASTPTGLELKSFVARHPRGDALADLFRRLDIAVAVETVDQAGFLARIASPKGDVELKG